MDNGCGICVLFFICICIIIFSFFLSCDGVPWWQPAQHPEGSCRIPNILLLLCYILAHHFSHKCMMILLYQSWVRQWLMRWLLVLSMCVCPAIVLHWLRVRQWLKCWLYILSLVPSCQSSSPRPWHFWILYKPVSPWWWALWLGECQQCSQSCLGTALGKYLLPNIVITVSIFHLYMLCEVCMLYIYLLVIYYSYIGLWCTSEKYQ